MAGTATVEFTDANFEEEVLKSDVPVVVDFWAVWCAPCRALAPTIDQLADEYAGRVKVGKVDTDANRDAAFQYGITNIPTVIIFKDGELHKKFVGLTRKEEFAAALDDII